MTVPLQLATTESHNPEQDRVDARHAQRNLKRIQAAIKSAEKQLEELRALEASIAEGQSSAEAIRVEYVRLWEARMESPYLGSVAKDITSIRHLRRQLGDNEIRKRLARYFAEGDEWFERQAFSLQIFTGKINMFADGPWESRRKKRHHGQQSSDADLFEQQWSERHQGRG